MMPEFPEKSRKKTDSRVWCYSGYRVDERPVRFKFQSVMYQITDIIRIERMPEEERFEVKVADGQSFLLRHLRDDEWKITEFS